MLNKMASVELLNSWFMYFFGQFRPKNEPNWP